LAALLLLGTVSAQQAQFQTKYETIISTYLGTNLGKALNLFAGDFLKVLPYPNMTSHMMNEAVGLVPSTKYLAAMGMFSTFQNCLNKSGSSLDQAGTKAGSNFKLKFQPLYKKTTDKVKAMRSYGKTDAEIRPEAFKILTAGTTKTIIQSFINLCMQTFTKAEYECSLPPLKAVMKTSLYNITYNPTIG
ncbi:hypothetical protein PMAYCL1PPCAC_04737, partial [Pristionchus mayeri]